jgi:hypothetical protein
MGSFKGETIMPRGILRALLIPILLGAPARAQFIAPGSTPQGDYLRGVGIASMGMGIYNERTAHANAINLQTEMTWNNYVSQAVRNQSRELAERKAYERAKHAAAKEAIQKRLRENPEDRDVFRGDALNSELRELMDPRISESSFRSAEVPLSVDLVRHIRFKLAERNEKFSMTRLLLKGHGKEPVTLRGPQFKLYLQAYERALDNAMEQAIDGKLTKPAIDDVQTAVNDLWRKLNDVEHPSRDTLYIEAKQRLEELEKVVETLKIQKVGQALGELDRYSGTTVNDLRLFMHRHNLEFAPAENLDERTLYPELYALFRLQREKIIGPLEEPNK